MTSVSSTTSTATTSSSTSSSAASLSSDYTTFLKLLTAQVQNQDPLSPMDTTEWTNQLVQYSSVEQQIESNGYLETIANAVTASSSSITDAVSYIGKTVSTDEDTATVTSGGSATWNYALGADATVATLTISDSSGNTIWSDSADDLSAGTHSFTWDGTDSSGNAVSAGDYTLSITATNGSGSVDASVGVSGTVTAVADDDGSTVLKVGNSTVALDSVTGVSGT